MCDSGSASMWMWEWVWVNSACMVKRMTLNIRWTHLRLLTWQFCASLYWGFTMLSFKMATCQILVIVEEQLLLYDFLFLPFFQQKGDEYDLREVKPIKVLFLLNKCWSSDWSFDHQAVCVCFFSSEWPQFSFWLVRCLPCQRSEPTSHLSAQTTQEGDKDLSSSHSTCSLYRLLYITSLPTVKCEIYCLISLECSCVTFAL